MQRPATEAHGSETASFAVALSTALEEAAHLLPDQAPIRVFIHHNTLHAFQHLHFHQAVLRGLEAYGAEPYLSEERFRRELARGRIRVADVEHALADQFPSAPERQLLPELSEPELRRVLMLHATHEASAAQLAWLKAEGKLTRRLRADLPRSAREALLADSDGDEARAADLAATACPLTTRGSRCMTTAAATTRPRQ
ncbi:MAG TPA: putative inorganic carbon transporter subunit DabA, partial [Polyangiales bacterium]